MPSFLLSAGAVFLAATTAWPAAAQPAAVDGAVRSAPALAPTRHPPVPRDSRDVWFAPDRDRSSQSASSTELARGVELVASGQYDKAAAVLSQPSLKASPLGAYALYYTGVCAQRLGRSLDARQTFRAVQDQRPAGYLAQLAALGEAEADEALKEPQAAVDIYERLLKGPVLGTDDVLLRLGRAARTTGDLKRSAEAFARVAYEFPLGDAAEPASAELSALPPLGAPSAPERFRLELARAERLFDAHQYGPARSAFEALRSGASGSDLELVLLRVAESDYYLKQTRAARDGVRPFIATASRQAEALYFYALASRDLGQQSVFRETARRIADEFPTASWADDALNDLAMAYIHDDEDEQADAVLRELYGRFPLGKHAERAAWKIGWRAYRNGHPAETVRYFEGAAAAFPRSDYRPAWLYWSGRAHEALKESALADHRFGLTIADYGHSYYGRLAIKRLNGRPLPPQLLAEGAASAEPRVPAPPSEPVIRALIASGLYDAALDEVRYAQRVWGDSPAAQATVAYIFWQQARGESGVRQFNLVRGAMNNMKRAYPQFLASSAGDLPQDVLRIIFPLSYWDLIRRYAALDDLDPFLLAALIAQESTFVPDIKSSAKAVGLMQLMPATARQYARRLNMPYSGRLLTNPEANVRMGAAYFADKVREFGALHLALASYNAGERPVRRWLAERPGIDKDEFVDDIPYPETQQYVKKILGTAEDYRRVYGPEVVALAEPGNVEVRAVSVVRRLPVVPIGARRPVVAARARTSSRHAVTVKASASRPARKTPHSRRTVVHGRRSA